MKVKITIRNHIDPLFRTQILQNVSVYIRAIEIQKSLKFTEKVMHALVLSEKNLYINFNTSKFRFHLLHKASHLLHLLWRSWLPLLLISLLPTSTGSSDAPASVHLYGGTRWPRANASLFSYRQILHIFDLQCSIIGHQLNYCWGVIILNLSVQNCRNEKEWLIIPTFACGSTTM